MKREMEFKKSGDYRIFRLFWLGKVRLLGFFCENFCENFIKSKK